MMPYTEQRALDFVAMWMSSLFVLIAATLGPPVSH